MENKIKTTAKDFFLHLGVIIGLYVSAISFLVLLFQIINKNFPLAGEYLNGIEYPIRMSLATLIIFFPAFIYLIKQVKKDLEINPEKKDVWVRRWMIFLTLFITGLTIAIDLVTLIYRFLGGEDLSLRFFLKVIVVLVVAVALFKYSLYDLRRTNFGYNKNMRISLYVVSTIILASVIYGIVVIGLPSTQRARNLDQTRINDLMSIQSQIVYSEWQNKGDIPVNLEALKDPISNYTVPLDPETKQNYEYKKITKNSFELCATFGTQNKTDTNTKSVAKNGYLDNENWQHDSGRYCFTRTIDEGIYKIEPQLKRPY
ncbi:MAG: DUF5671 domain-containing protein [Candidatus Pacebacteria bacterium]|nr:DUF5671 domain-containing protein [Candidatus Paceibacterota bacterium]